MSARDKFELLFSILSDAGTVAPSKIGGQFYCEKKVDLEHEHGEVETSKKQQDCETHEKAISIEGDLLAAYFAEQEQKMAFEIVLAENTTNILGGK